MDQTKVRFGQSSTLKHYPSNINIFFRTVGDKPPKEVSPADIDAFIDQHITAGLNPTTISRRVWCIPSFYEYFDSCQLAHFRTKSHKVAILAQTFHVTLCLIILTVSLELESKRYIGSMK